MNHNRVNVYYVVGITEALKIGIINAYYVDLHDTTTLRNADSHHAQCGYASLFSPPRFLDFSRVQMPGSWKT